MMKDWPYGTLFVGTTIGYFIAMVSTAQSGDQRAGISSGQCGREADRLGCAVGERVSRYPDVMTPLSGVVVGPVHGAHLQQGQDGDQGGPPQHHAGGQVSVRSDDGGRGPA